MSIAPLSISAEREEALDFTKPFKNRNIKLLMQKPEPKSGYFQFMDPLSEYVWISIFSVIIVCSFLLFVLEYFSRNINKKMANKLNVQESYWFMFAALVGVAVV